LHAGYATLTINATKRTPSEPPLLAHWQCHC